MDRTGHASHSASPCAYPDRIDHEIFHGGTSHSSHCLVPDDCIGHPFCGRWSDHAIGYPVDVTLKKNRKK